MDRGDSRALLGSVSFALLTIAGLASSPETFAYGDKNLQPTLSCGFRGLEPVSVSHYEAGNLERLTLVPSLFDNGHRVEKLFDAAEALRHKVKDEPTLEITVTSLADDRGKVRIYTTTSGSGGGLGFHRRTVNLAIPISFEQAREGFEIYFQRVLDYDDPDVDQKKLEQQKERLRVAKAKEGVFGYLFGLIYENEPGLYRIDCAYRSTKDGFWNGEIEAQPIFLEIRFEKAFFDLDNFLPPEQQSK